MAQFIALVLFVCTFLAGSNSTGAAAAAARVRHPVTVSNGVITIANQPVLRLRTALAGVSPEQRAEIIALRLRELIDRGADPGTLRLQKEGPYVHLYFAEVLLFSITPEEARAQDSTADSLAAYWVARLRILLSTPLLTVNTTRLVVPLGETRALTFGGLLKAPLVAAGATDIAGVTLDTAQQKAVVTGLKAGDARFLFTHEEITLPVDVLVRPYAGRVPPTARGAVTGAVAPQELVERIALTAARQNLTLEPGATVMLGAPDMRRGLRAGAATRIVVPVHIEAPQCLPVDKRIQITVQNLPLPRADTPELFYSNHPERVTGYGTLFLGRLSQIQPARLLYHHQNDLGKRIALVVEVTNPGTEPARLHVVEGQAPPLRDPINAGLLAARDFLQNDTAGIGYVAVLPPRSRVTVVRNTLRPGEIASGLFGLRQLDGSTFCGIHVKADDVNAPFVNPPDDDAEPSPTAFGSAVKAITAAYEVGGQWCFIRLGSASQREPSRLSLEGFGDYGITYEIELTLRNPTNRRRDVALVFEAASGPARGLFLVSGKLIETQTLSAQQEIVLSVHSLPPGGRRNLHVTTLPLSGSAYPARLVVRELPEHAAVRPGSLLQMHSQ